jgi:hypothetical protein
MRLCKTMFHSWNSEVLHLNLFNVCNIWIYGVLHCDNMLVLIYEKGDFWGKNWFNLFIIM